MNDTHGVEGKGWYGFDLDGTLAVYDKWEGIDHIGEPVKHMVDLIKKMHAEGKVVKILTARVAPRADAEIRPNPHCSGEASSPLPDYANKVMMRNPPSRGEVPRSVLGAFYSMADWTAANFITDWCLKNLGFLPEITHEKDHLMLMLFDDRVKQVVPNEGLLVEDLYRECGEMLKKTNADAGWLLAKLESKRNGFWAGFMLCVLATLLGQIGCVVYDRYFTEKTPDQVRVKKVRDALCDLLRDWPKDWTVVPEIRTNGVYMLEAR